MVKSMGWDVTLWLEHGQGYLTKVKKMGWGITLWLEHGVGYNTMVRTWVGVSH